MNYYKPRQRLDNQRWEYSNHNSVGMYATGYCHPWRPFTPDRVHMSQEYCDKLNHEEAPFVSKYHDDGHATPEEACECYRQYELDHSLRFFDPPENPKTLHRCVICDIWTAGMAEVGQFKHWYLCDMHRTRETVETLYPSVGESFGSY